MQTKTDTLVEISVQSQDYVIREELDAALFDLRVGLESSKKFSSDEVNEMLKAIDSLVAPKRFDLYKGKRVEVDNEIPVTLKIEAEDLLSIIYESKADEIWNFVAANFDTDAFVEEVKDAGVWPKDFIPAIKFNNPYEFKRYICDVLEVGYHADDWECVKGIACYINPDFKVL